VERESNKEKMKDGRRIEGGRENEGRFDGEPNEVKHTVSRLAFIQPYIDHN
jgi:hypothetical protein